MDDEVIVAGGGNYWNRVWSNEELLKPLPPPPKFDESIEKVRDRIAKAIGTVIVPREVRIWHPAIDRLNKGDDKRREKQLASPYPMSWDDPIFTSSFEQRRLKILNSLFLAIAKMDGKPTIRGREARDVHLTFHQQHIAIGLDRPKYTRARASAATTTARTEHTLSFFILRGLGSDDQRATWQDGDEGKLEARMAEIAVEIALTAEIQHRERAARQHEWRIERKAKLEEEGRKRTAEAERAERERKKRIEQARIDRLLKDASALQQAGIIRAYVGSVRSLQAADPAISSEDLERWCQWALGQADRIDPSIGGAFLATMRDESDE